MAQEIFIRKIKGKSLQSDIGASMMIVMFYAMEMSKQLNWSVEHRYFQIMQIRKTLSIGKSKMLLAEDSNGMPIGMTIYTQTDKKNIRRLDALMVTEPMRKKGIAKQLLLLAKAEKDLHVYATPNSESWYQKNGFKKIISHPEGTIEMFTGDYIPKYNFKFIVTMPSEMDFSSIEDLKLMENSLKL